MLRVHIQQPGQRLYLSNLSDFTRPLPCYRVLGNRVSSGQLSRQVCGQSRAARAGRQLGDQHQMQGFAAAGTTSTLKPALTTQDPTTLRLAVVGDVHKQWDTERDPEALRALGVDVAVFVGDLADEDANFVSGVAAVGFPKAVILGNHDAWFSMKLRASKAGRTAAPQMLSAVDMLMHDQVHSTSGGVGRQLVTLGDSHLGYRAVHVEGRQYSLVGARPFSKGGKSEGSLRDFLSGFYPGVESMQTSADHIVKAVRTARPHDAVILVGHNGPTGLGSEPHDPCGVDWEKKGSDHGDPDLRMALEQLAATHADPSTSAHAGSSISAHAEASSASLHSPHVALVLFGHMHHRLHRNVKLTKLQSSRQASVQEHDDAGRPLRCMAAVDVEQRTVYLNAATVPRIKTTQDTQSQGATDHHFLVVEMSKGEVTSANNIWVQVAHAPEVSTSTSPSTCSKVSQHSMPAVDPSLLNNQQASSAAAAAGPGSSNSASHSGPAHTAASNGKDNVEMSPPCLQGHGKYRANVIRSHPLLRTVLDEGGRVKYAYTWDAHHLQEVFHDLSRPGTNTVSAADGGGVASSPIIAHNAAGSRGQEMAANLPA